ncbi:MAG: hypothetical protein WC459_03780 [Patescibacteria group bacterium]
MKKMAADKTRELQASVQKRREADLNKKVKAALKIVTSLIKEKAENGGCIARIYFLNYAELQEDAVQKKIFEHLEAMGYKISWGLYNDSIGIAW